MFPVQQGDCREASKPAGRSIRSTGGQRWIRQGDLRCSRNRELTAQLLGFCRDDDEGLFKLFIESQPQPQES